MDFKKISSVLISVYHKDGLAPLIELFKRYNVKIFSTGGTQKFVEDLGAEVTAVEDLTAYPSILGGRVKTLHPKVFGGILSRRDNGQDQKQVAEFEIPEIDMVIVDLYPFDDTVASGASHQDIIEKIDIGGISLIRAAAKNYQDVMIISSREQYPAVEELLSVNNCSSSLEQRKHYAGEAFDISSHYDTAIYGYFKNDEPASSLKISLRQATELRYGENPHQKGFFHGQLDQLFDQLNGKALSYNNLVDVDAATRLIAEFGDDTAFAIIKHTNACGVAIASSVKEAFEKALAADPISAFGGILVTNKAIDLAAAQEIHKLFCEVLIAPSYSKDAIELLTTKKNRIVLVQKTALDVGHQAKTLLNGMIKQEVDRKTDDKLDLKVVTKVAPTEEETMDLLFASKIAKHTKSNTIVLAKHQQMISSGVGQTSRVDALDQAIKKAKSFNFNLKGTVMASDAFFPFPDCVEIANNEGIAAVIQPGGSVKDQLSIDYCDQNEMAMVFTGFRHFYH